MRDSLALFWFRYKYVVIGVGVVVAGALGFLTSRGGSEPAAVTTPVAETFDVSTLEARSEGVELCAEYEPMTIGRRSCLTGVGGTIEPLLLPGADGDKVLVGWSEDEPPVPTDVPVETRALIRFGVAVDLDNDGQEELVFALSKAPGVPDEDYQLVLVLKKSGDGYVDATGQHLPSGLGALDDRWSREPVDGFVPGDWNGDGWVDIVFYRSEGGPDKGAGILVNQGRLEPGVLISPNTGSYPAGDDYTMFRGAMRNIFDKVTGFDGKAGFVEIAAVDVDDDGWQDLVLLTRIGVLAVVKGGADFYPRTDVYELPAGASDLVIADFDGDRIEDIVVSVADSMGGGGPVCPAGRPCDLTQGFAEGGVLFLAGSADGTFERVPAWDLAAVGAVAALGVIDLDNDGALELLTGDARFSAASVGDVMQGGLRAFSYRDGLFTEDTFDSSKIASVERIYVADVNGDGNEDIVTYGRSKNSVQQVIVPAGGEYLRVVVEGSANLTVNGTHSDAVGALVTITEGTRKYVRSIGAAASSLGRAAGYAHFGLGQTDGSIDLVEVLFPLTGRKVLLTNVEPGQTLRVAETAN